MGKRRGGEGAGDAKGWGRTLETETATLTASPREHVWERERFRRIALAAVARLEEAKVGERCTNAVDGEQDSRCRLHAETVQDDKKQHVGKRQQLQRTRARCGAL